MADIKVEFQRLDDFSVKQKKMSLKAAEIGQKLNSLKGSLDWDIAGSSGIDRRISEVCRDIEAYRQSLSNMSDYLVNASKEYKQCENELAEGGNKDIWNDILRAGIGGIGGIAGIAGYEVFKAIENIFSNNHQNADAKPSSAQNAAAVPSTAASQTPPLSGTLSYNPGQYSKEVEEMQRRLNELGYKGKDGKPLDVDGKFGVNTLKAVNDFKRNNNLGNNGQYEGKVGSTSWPVLFSEDAVKAKNTSEQHINPDNIFQKSTDTLSAEEKRNELISEAKKWVGKIPYRRESTIVTMDFDEYVKAHGTPPPWMDCADFSSSIYKTVFDIDIGQNTYAQIERGAEVVKGNSPATTDFKPGDLILFDWPDKQGNRNGVSDHVAMYIGKNAEGQDLYIHESGSTENYGKANQGNVKISTMNNYSWESIISIRRIIQNDGEIINK